MGDNSNRNLKLQGKAKGIFYFKQFKVKDGRSTMKVGTDAVLLGTVTKVVKSDNILEIGTGSGVIALILAQRSEALIDAIEIDSESAGQASENIKSSPWKERISIIHDSLQEYAIKTSKRYDLIVCNPPFFSCSLKSPDKKRNLSRHDEMLTYGELIRCSNELMAPGGSLWVILPCRESDEFSAIAKKSGLLAHFRMMIVSKTGRPGHRYILQFQKEPPAGIEENTVAILDENGHHTAEYKELTKEFYIDF